MRGARFSGEGVFWLIVVIAIGAGIYFFTAKHPPKPPARFFHKVAKQAESPHPSPLRGDTLSRSGDG